MPGPEQDEGVSTLVKRLVADAQEYGRAEMAYVQALARERTSDATHGVGLLAGAAVIAMAMLTTLLVGLVLSLSPLVGPFWATLIVVASAAVIAAILAKLGIAKVREAVRRDTSETTTP